jgi:hypothetical protein
MVLGGGGGPLLNPSSWARKLEFPGEKRFGVMEPRGPTIHHNRNSKPIKLNKWFILRGQSGGGGGEGGGSEDKQGGMGGGGRQRVSKRGAGYDFFVLSSMK